MARHHAGPDAWHDDTTSYTFTANPEITMGTCVTSVLPQVAAPPARTP